MHFRPQLSCQIWSPSKTGFIVSANRLTNITLLTLIAALLFEGESPTYILNEDTQPVIRSIGLSHTACIGEFRQNLRSHSRSVFPFLRYIVNTQRNNTIKADWHLTSSRGNYQQHTDCHKCLPHDLAFIISTDSNT